ncbi:unnamed protein product [Dibothriocephalus latus]|uniref:Protein MEMO1 n=1 Tax=Dibothriocephalus latus TaxID=60516 RepID=A0A3P7LPG6_DIBLA|nr:unnamed protein product [Dibothriocephalus latus]
MGSVPHNPKGLHAIPAKELNLQLSTWLDSASGEHGPAKAIISPYGCMMYTSPLVCKALKKSGEFVDLRMSEDEDEHSLEMQLPYVAKVMESRAKTFTIVPIMVGSLSFEKERVYGEILAPYLQDPRTLFVISSDFCHWGSRFRYTYYDQKQGEIWQSIKNLDKMGMDSIETMNPEAFDTYIKKYRNTICGRHPIGVLLHAMNTLRNTQQGSSFSLKFVQYAQSNKCHNERDSSVSYAAASVVMN